MWYTPAVTPLLIKFFKPITFLASDSSSGSAVVFHISLRLQKKKKKYNREGGKRRTTNKHGFGSTPSTRKGALCDDFLQVFVHFVDYRGRVFFAKLLQKSLGMPIHLWPSSFSASFCWPSFPWTLSHADWSLLLSFVDCLSLSFFVDSPLSSLSPSFPPPLPVSSEISSSSPLFGFRAKTDKEIVCLAYNTLSVTLETI